MRKVIVLLVLVATMLSIAGIAVAFTASDYLAPRLARITESVVELTGWNCQWRVQETDDYLVAGVYCDK